MSILACTSVVIALAAGQPAPPSAAPASAASTERGIVFAVQFGARLATIAFAGPVNVVEGGFTAGFKYQRLIIGLGIEASRFGSGATGVTTLIFVPGVQFALLRTLDERVEFYAEADVGGGRIISDGMTGSGSDVRYQFGLGLRYWLHPQLAISMTSGLRGDVINVSTFGGGNSPSATVSIIAAFQFLGVFPI